jgi:hypothetical protein
MNIQYLKKKAQSLKAMELQTIIVFILTNQKYKAFWLFGADSRTSGQGMMRLTMEGDKPVLDVNWDECFPFDDQEQMFKDLFEYSYISDKRIVITGIKL